MTAPGHVPVLIVGGGPVGLALAVDLGWRGIRCALIDQGNGTVGTPKMNEVNTRTMEFCRRWGVSDAVMNCPFPGDFPIDVVFVTSMSGYELARLARPARNSQEPEPYSPMRFQVCSQIWFDPILQAKARTLPGVSLHYHQRLDTFEQSDAGVVATVTDLESGRSYKINADYIVGCDGATSRVRQTLGIDWVGKGTLGSPVHTYFRHPNLLEKFGRERGTFFFPIGPKGPWGTMRVIDPANGLWRLLIDNVEGAQRPEDVDKEHYLRLAVGQPLDVEWLDVNIWRRRSVVASSYGQGRAFVVGDAVHQLSPTGALGMNSGIGDAVDIGWKLAAVLQGWGGPKLLDTYDTERRPVGHRNVDMATRFYFNIEEFGGVSAALEDDTPQGERARKELGARLAEAMAPEFRTIGAQIGYRYEDSPLIVPDGTPPTPDASAVYEPTARPGARAPHVWLRDGRSILELYDKDFTLLRFPGAPDTSALEAAAKSRGVPLASASIDEADAATLYASKLVLVRPDGHVAWRSDTLPSDPTALIDQVRGA